MALVLLFLQTCCMMFMLSKVSMNYDIKDYEQRILAAVTESTPPTLIVTLTVLVPCCCGIVSKYKAIELLCTYTVLTVIFSFVNHMTLFVACLALHEKRIDEGKHCCTCRPIQSRREARESQKSGCFICCCTGSVPSSPNDTDHAFLKFPKFLLSYLVLRMPCRIISTIACAGLIAVSVWLSLDIKADVFVNTDIKPGSYLYDFNIVNQHFPISTIITLFTTDADKTVKNSSLKILSDIAAYQRNIEQETVSQTTIIFWGASYNAKNCTPAIAKRQLSRCLKTFIDSHGQFQSDIAFDRNGSVSVFRLYLTVTATRPVGSLVHLMDTLGSSITLGGLKFTAYSPHFLFIDSYMFALWDLLRFSGIQLVVLTVCVGLGLKDAILCVHVGIWYTITCIGTLGFVRLFGISTITPVGTAAYMLAIHMCIPVIVFSYCTYASSCALNRTSRTHHMLVSTCAFLLSVLFALSVILLILLLVQSYVFVTVFKVTEACCCSCIIVNCMGIPSSLTVLGSNKTTRQSQGSARDITLKETNSSYDNKVFKSESS